MATTKVIKKSRIRKGKIVRQGELQGPAVATGTTVTSANSAEEPVLLPVFGLAVWAAAGDGRPVPATVKLAWIPLITNKRELGIIITNKFILIRLAWEQ